MDVALICLRGYIGLEVMAAKLGLGPVEPVTSSWAGMEHSKLAVLRFRPDSMAVEPRLLSYCLGAQRFLSMEEGRRSLPWKPVLSCLF